MLQTNKLRAFFNQLDADGSGEVNFEELCTQMTKLGFCQSDQMFRKLFEDMDADGDGLITFIEFEQMMTVANVFQNNSTNQDKKQVANGQPGQ